MHDLRKGVKLAVSLFCQPDDDPPLHLAIMRRCR
jgi:hypothetical protein